jgi:hypothetical protein
VLPASLLVHILDIAARRDLSRHSINKCENELLLMILWSTVNSELMTLNRSNRDFASLDDFAQICNDTRSIPCFYFRYRYDALILDYFIDRGPDLY